MKILIGLTGEKGAGKGIISKRLEERFGDSLEIIVFSKNIITPTLALWNLPSTRENMQLLAQIMNEQFGDDTLSNAARELIRKSTADIVLLDGVRWQKDQELVRSFPNNILVYITASPETRYSRLKQRGEKTGEGTLTFEQFLKEEQAPNETLIKTIGQSADVIIENENSMQDLEQAIEDLYQKHIAPKL